MSFGNSDRAAYSDLNPRDGGQSLYPMSTVLMIQFVHRDMWPVIHEGYNKIVPSDQKRTQKQVSDRYTNWKKRAKKKLLKQKPGLDIEHCFFLRSFDNTVFSVWQINDLFSLNILICPFQHLPR